MEKFWPGLLIVFEGLDGCGKLTQARLLMERLDDDPRFDLAYFDFPNYDENAIAGLIRTTLRSPEVWWKWPWEAKEALYAADRVCQRSQLVTALQKPNGIAVCNRYVPSGQAYSAGSFDNEAAWRRCFGYVDSLEYWMNEMPRPHIVVHLTMPDHRAQELAQGRGYLDAHEQNAQYLHRVGQAYSALAQRSPDVWYEISAEVAGGVQSPEEVHERVWLVLQAHAEWQRFLTRVSEAAAPAVAE